MAVKKPEQAPEVNPPGGGSFMRNKDGTLTQTEGPGMEPAAADTALPAATKPNPNSQE